MKHTEQAKKKIGEASKNRKRSAKNIEAVRKARIKSVNVYDLQGNLLKKCESVIDAEKFTNIDNSNISAACKGRYKQIKGFVFKYADEKQDIPKIFKHRKAVNMYSFDGEYIKTFETIKQAQKETNICDTHITDCCKGKYKQSGGYIWKYAQFEHEVSKK